ncbi:putative exonuclease GOR isoform X2 [Centruroides sculpturatus]|nr:putative exonuclease GOR isoform X2 [Centruroides sculpturatus]XP_023232185.1 putative exonuclease GOR isoform X2 [Centruroides sculpturatus]
MACSKPFYTYHPPGIGCFNEDYPFIVPEEYYYNLNSSVSEIPFEQFPQQIYAGCPRNKRINRNFDYRRDRYEIPPTPFHPFQQPTYLESPRKRRISQRQFVGIKMEIDGDPPIPWEPSPELYCFKLPKEGIDQNVCFKIGTTTWKSIPQPLELPCNQHQFVGCKMERKEEFFISFYSFLEKIMLTPSQLMAYKFPMQSVDKASCGEIDLGSLIERCARCRSEYNSNIDDLDDICVYHPKKAISVLPYDTSYQIYPCCNTEKGSIGCTFNNFHVSSSKCRANDDFLNTAENDFTEKNIVVLDTEMCYTKLGLEITKLTLLSFDGSLLFETYVQPRSPIIDYNTEYSGITAEMLEKNTLRFEEVQESLLNIINKDTIIIGHALENDLQALHFIHAKIVDTSVIFDSERGFCFRPSLKSLSEKYLGQIIQENAHDSREDCQVCLELVLLKWNHFSLELSNS